MMTDRLNDLMASIMRHYGRFMLSREKSLAGYSKENS